MSRPQPIKVRPGKRGGEWLVSVPPGWELRLRRVLSQMLADALPPLRERGLTATQVETRRRVRRHLMQRAICQFMADLVTADIVGKEVALSTRSRYGRRTGSLREHVQAILSEASRR
jgi:hypothetical protein